MNKTVKQLVVATVLLLFAFAARANFMELQVVSDTRRTLEGLGNKFIVGCAVLAVGMVVAAFVRRKR